MLFDAAIMKMNNLSRWNDIDFAILCCFFCFEKGLNPFPFAP